MGYKHRAEKIFHTVETGVVRAKYVEQYPPDTNAALAWLSRRQPELWKERQEVNVTGSLEHRLSQMTADLCAAFGVGESTVQAKARVIEKTLRTGVMPRAVQEVAFARGIIPYIPADGQDRS